VPEISTTAKTALLGKSGSIKTGWSTKKLWKQRDKKRKGQTMVKQVTEWIAEDGTRCSTEQEAKDYELRCSKLFLIRPLIAGGLSQLCPDAQDAVARFIVKDGKALLEIMTRDELWRSQEHPKPGRAG